MDLKTIVITWMPDVAGATRVMTCENATTNVLNGVLHVYTYRLSGTAGIVRTLNKSWHFPISNIRAWGPEEWDGDHGILLHPVPEPESA